MSKVFISWSKPTSQAIAQEIQKLGRYVFSGHQPFISNEIEPGSNWWDDLSSNIQESSIAIICMTPENLYSKWIMFEAGAVWKSFKKTRVIPLLFGLKENDLDHPLSAFKNVTLDKEGVFEAFKTIGKAMGDEQETLKERFEDAWKKSEPVFQELEKKVQHKWMAYQGFWSLMEKTMNSLEERGASFEATIVSYLLDNCAKQISKDVASTQDLLLPYQDYPKIHLKYLTENPNAIVRALALVDEDENFWGGALGDEIRAQTHSKSIRIFVFKEKDQLLKSLSYLERHSQKYEVFVASNFNVRTRRPEFYHDFSITTSGDERFLAKYEEYDYKKYIKFIADPRQLNEYGPAFRDMMNVAESFQAGIHGKSESEINSFIDTVFLKASTYRKREVEMSEYISIDDYDDFESDHPYYLEMMDAMLQIHEQTHTNANPSSLECLEFGAGTGIFTLRLAEKFPVNITAVELDTSCYNKLEAKVERLTVASGRDRIETLREDSRFFDPDGEFHSIFSSFSDHHIRDIDKAAYFSNVERNLKPGGVFIVGDEFLPEYDPDDAASYDDALERYHTHIIDKAMEEGNSEVAELERAALKSGLKRQGDFKLSLRLYKESLDAAGFKVEENKIGPLDIEDVGGVYVCKITIK